MNFLVGSAVEIFCEVPSDKVSGTTLTLESLKDPDGNELATSQTLTFSEVSGEEHIASYVWQSTEGTNPIGKYDFVIKSVNGIYENFNKGSFYLEAHP